MRNHDTSLGAITSVETTTSSVIGCAAQMSLASDDTVYSHVCIGGAAWPKVLASLTSLAALPASAATAGDLDSVEKLIVVLVIAVTVLPAIAISWWFWDSLYVTVQDSTNDDDAAARMFIDLFERAQSTLIIYDDGNKMDGTIYDSPQVIAAVRKHLENNKDLSVRCLFNDRDDLGLVQAMRAEYPDRFKVWYRVGNRPADVHYKIVDDGAVGHISWHDHGQRERQFKLLDCAKAKPRTRRIVLGEQLAQFESDIEEHAVAAT